MCRNPYSYSNVMSICYTKWKSLKTSLECREDGIFGIHSKLSDRAATEKHVITAFVRGIIIMYVFLLRLRSSCVVWHMILGHSSLFIAVCSASTSNPFQWCFRGKSWLVVSIRNVSYFSAFWVFTARCTMHNAKRGLAIACRLSVYLSVRLSVCLWRWWFVIT